MTVSMLEPVEAGRYRIRGDLTFATVTAVARGSTGLFGQGSGPMVIDLTEVGRADSAGLALLVEWMREARAVGREVSYRGAPEQIRTIAAVSDLEDILPLEP